jgi:hypothetical protein
VVVVDLATGSGCFGSTFGTAGVDGADEVVVGGIGGGTAAGVGV